MWIPCKASGRRGRTHTLTARGTSCSPQVQTVIHSPQKWVAAVEQQCSTPSRPGKGSDRKSGKSDFSRGGSSMGVGSNEAIGSRKGSLTTPRQQVSSHL